MSRKLALAVAIACLPLGACVIAPLDGHVVQTPYDVIEFAGAALEPGALVVVEAENQATHAWEPIGSTRTSTTASTLRGRTFYRWSVNASIATTGLPSTLRHWSKAGQILAGDSHALVRVRAAGSNPMTLFTVDGKTLSCVRTALASKESADVAMVYFDCNASGMRIIRLTYIG